MAVKKKKKVAKKKLISKKRLLKKRPVARKKAAPKAKKRISATKKPKIKKAPGPPPIGEITHFFPHVQAGVIKLKAPLEVGQSIKIKGHTTDFTQVVESMQIDRVPITKAEKGAEIGLKVTSRVRGGDLVYKA